MALQIDSMAIKSAAKRLEVIGNNVANANTVGFKGAEFLESLAAAMSTETGATSVGGRQSFAQGDLGQSNNPLDIAISGAGFFRIENGEKVAYTRSGQFSLNKDGEIVNTAGDKLTGFQADPESGMIKSGNPIPLIISQANDAPKPTAKATLELMLDSRSPVITAPFSDADPTTYTHSTTTTVYTAQGKEVNVQTFYVKTADNDWDVYSWAGGTEPAGKLGSLTFGTNGLVASSTNYDATTGASTAAATKGTFGITLDGTPMSFDLGDTTQYGSKFTVRVSQDGRGVGQLLSYGVAEDGIISARYNNGNSKVLGQVVLANFRSLNGLQPVGNSQWLESAASGSAEINQPGVGVLGSLKAASTESSNVDLTVEMIKMISAQRSFQAAAEMMRRQDESMQALNNIGR